MVYTLGMQNLEKWFNSLATLSDMPHVHNLFSNQTPEGVARLANLRQYVSHVLEQRPTTLLVGEAPGYQGTYRTGIPFCSESIMMGPQNKFGLFGGEANGYQRVLAEPRLWKEPSATIVQRTINQLPELPLIWATFPLHPHKPGVELSNRPPTSTEIALGTKLLRELIAIINPQQVVAVGNVAEKCLHSQNIDAIKVRHPSHGGATLFSKQLLCLLG